MQDFEKLRHTAALTAYRQAFLKSYEESKRALDERATGPDPSVPSIFYLEVPCDDVLDGLWQQYLPKFHDAGRLAAIASKRQREAVLDETSAQDNANTLARGTFQWRVVLNPT
jgi:hypothetical protein